jgi:hypothetical protein
MWITCQDAAECIPATQGVKDVLPAHMKATAPPYLQLLDCPALWPQWPCWCQRSSQAGQVQLELRQWCILVPAAAAALAAGQQMSDCVCVDAGQKSYNFKPMLSHVASIAELKLLMLVASNLAVSPDVAAPPP